MRADRHPETVMIDLPWIETARAKKLEAFQQFESYRRAWDRFNSGEIGKPPEPAFQGNPWIKVLIAETAINRAAARLPKPESHLESLDRDNPRHRLQKALLDARVAKSRAEEALHDMQCRVRGAPAEAASRMYELGEAVRHLRRFEVPVHIARINKERQSGGEVRRMIREIVEASVGTLPPKQVLEEITKRTGWTYLDGKVCKARRDRIRNRLVCASVIVGWGRFQNIVSEENKRLLKSLHATACAVKP